MGLSALGLPSSGLGQSVFGSSSSSAVGGAKRERQVSFGETPSVSKAESGDAAAAAGGSKSKRRRKPHIALGRSAPIVEVEFEDEGAEKQLAR